MISIEPKSIPYPDIPFDKSLIGLTLTPMVMGSTVEANMGLQFTPYRILPDESIETNDGMSITNNVGSVFSTAESDPVLNTLITSIYNAIQVYVTTKGI